jgi:hypothetical protein
MASTSKVVRRCLALSDFPWSQPVRLFFRLRRSIEANDEPVEPKAGNEKNSGDEHAWQCHIVVTGEVGLQCRGQQPHLGHQQNDYHDHRRIYSDAALPARGIGDGLHALSEW